MCKHLENHLKKHRALYLAALAIALFATAALVISQAEWFGQIMPELRGYMRVDSKEFGGGTRWGIRF